MSFTLDITIVNLVITILSLALEYKFYLSTKTLFLVSKYRNSYIYFSSRLAVRGSNPCFPCILTKYIKKWILTLSYSQLFELKTWTSCWWEKWLPGFITPLTLPIFSTIISNSISFHPSKWISSLSWSEWDGIGNGNGISLWVLRVEGGNEHQDFLCLLNWVAIYIWYA